MADLQFPLVDINGNPGFCPACLHDEFTIPLQFRNLTYTDEFYLRCETCGERIPVRLSTRTWIEEGRHPLDR